jgi:alpha-galactosidase
MGLLRAPSAQMLRALSLSLFFPLILFSGTLVSRPSPVAALSNGLALTPPMGWNSWYGLGCNVSAAAVEQAAYGMAANGLRDAGYTYVNVDDCWQGPRDANGTITADPDRFPDGLQPVIDYVHTLGMKFGLYTDAGSATCMGFPGSLGHEQQDADTYAQWGVDFVKVDWCNSTGLDPASQYDAMRDALHQASTSSGQPMVFSICDWGVDAPWAWGPATGNMWRTTADIGDPQAQWDKFLKTLDQNSGHASVARPGGWNDPDALEVGLGWLTDTEDRSQFSLWAIMAAPLLLSNDPATMSDFTMATVTNRDVIAIDQDPAGVQGSVVGEDSSGQLQVWVKPLAAQNTWAVALFNRGSTETDMATDWQHDLGFSGAAQVREIWSGAPASTSKDGYRARVPGHGVVLLEVTVPPTPATH